MGESEITYREWVHGPTHLFKPGAAYIVTAGSYQKLSYWNTPAKRNHFLEEFFRLAQQYQWSIEAWALMDNHYHFVAQAPDDSNTLTSMIRDLHAKTALWLNQQDKCVGRKVWFQYWDTCLTYEKSYLARLNYVHNNAVKHGLVERAEEYPWCSMGWFVRQAKASFRRTVLSIKSDCINIEDDF